jgi:hypothetical protein
LFPAIGFSQSNTYDLDIYPDLWYNSVDGVRVGGFFLGQMDGEFQSGPHRLNAGVWLSTKFPGLPVSYHIEYSKPVPFISSHGNEGNVVLNSSIRTGFSRHKLSLNKGWKRYSEKFDYLQLTGGLRIEKRFNEDYVHYPEFWDDLPKIYRQAPGAGQPKNWYAIFNLGFKFSERDDDTHILFNLNIDKSVNKPVGAYNNENYWKATATFNLVNFLTEFEKFKFRLFADANSGKPAPQEYQYSVSGANMIEWVDNPFTRAKGTLPTSYFETGLIQLAGGANVRGMSGERFIRYDNGDIILHGFTSSINLELDFPNLINRNLSKTKVGDFLKLNTYIFYDQGFFINLSNDFTIGNIGPGISLDINIPELLGKKRALYIRYDMPLYLFKFETNYPTYDLDSEPPAMEFQTEFGYKFRQIIGIGAVISL